LIEKIERYAGKNKQMRDKEEMKALKEEVILFNMGANKII